MSIPNSTITSYQIKLLLFQLASTGLQVGNTTRPQAKVLSATNNNNKPPITWEGCRISFFFLKREQGKIEYPEVFHFFSFSNIASAGSSICQGACPKLLIQVSYLLLESLLSDDALLV